MLKLTRFNGTNIYLSAEQIELIESTPDTIVTMVNGKKYIVKEKAEEVAKAFIRYKKAVGNTVSIINKALPADNQE